MSKILRIIVVLMLCSNAIAQPLRDINYKYLYDPNEKIHLDISAVKSAGEWLVHYELISRDTAVKFSETTIEWDVRESISDKSRTPIVPQEFNQSPGAGSFKITFNQPGYLVGKVINNSLKRAWIFYSPLDPNHPVNAYLEKERKPIYTGFVNVRDSVVLRGMGNGVVSYYNDNFPISQPPFAEALGKVSKGMSADSLFSIREGEPMSFTKKGLYLFQTDTNAVSGVTVRVEEDYPKLSRIQSLAAPLVYISTSNEYNRLMQAKNDKKAFDRVILSITNDRERASRLMRNYFKAVELANKYFTSYKEGWKTDRGMIYIVFGAPDEVFKFADREVWNYSSDDNVSFTFVKSSTVFDPENYVLLRDKKYQQIWYRTIDLWRGSRF